MTGATLGNYYSAYVEKGISGLSRASLIIQENTFDLLATHQANHGKYIDLTTNYSYQLTRAELRAFSIQANQVNYVLYPYESKLNKLLCNYNPILNTNNLPVMIHNLEYSYGSDTDKLNDKNYVFDAGWTTKYAIFKQKASNQLVYHADFDEYDTLGWHAGGGGYWTPITPTNTTGDMQYSYYYDKEIANNEFGAYFVHALDGYQLGVATYFDVFVSNSNIVDKLTISGVVSFRPLSIGHPKIYIYNYDTSAWEEIKEFEAVDVGGNSAAKQEDDVFGYSQCPDITFSIEVDTDVANYLTNEGTQPDGALGKYTVKVMVSSLYQLNGNHTVHIHNLELKVDLNTNQYLELGQGYISSSSNATKQIVFLATPSWISDTPSQQGICAGDVMYIADDLDAVIAAINIVLDGAYDIDADITHSDRTFITEDLTNTSVYQFMETISKETNSVWWVDDATSKIIIKSVDNLIDSGIIIQASDIMNYNTALYYQEDSSPIRSTLIIEGNSIEYQDSLSPDVTLNTLETEINRSSKTETQTQAVTLFNKERHKFENTHKIMRFTKRVTASDTGLEVGKLITVQLPSTSEPTLDFSVANKLLITKIEWEKHPNLTEFVTLTLKRRYN